MAITPPRILIVRLSAIGDVARTLPALEALRRTYPEAHIAWLVEDRAAAVVRGHPALDAVYVFDRKPLSAHLRRPWKWRALARALLGLAAELRRRPYDVVFDFQSLVKSSILARATGAQLIVGFTPDHCREPVSALFTNAHLDPGDARLPRGVRNGRMIAHFTPPAAGSPRATWHDSAAATAWAEGVLAEFNGRAPIVMHPGTSRAEKWWSPAGWAEVGDELAERTGRPVLLTWGPDEEDATAAVVLRMSCDGKLAAPTPTLHHLVALIRGAACFLTIDNGPMHLAAMTDAPIVGLFGPVDVQVNQPDSPRMRCVCAQGIFGPGEAMPAYGGTMIDLRPADVITAALDLLGQ